MSTALPTDKGREKEKRKRGGGRKEDGLLGVARLGVTKVEVLSDPG